MRILIAAVGSRGDVAPLTGLGMALRGAGCDVSLASYAMFEELITGCGLGFRLIPGDPELMGASAQGHRWQEGGSGPMGAIRFVRLIAGHLRDVNAALLQAARQDTDVLLLAGMAGPLGKPGTGPRPDHRWRDRHGPALETAVG